MKNFGKCRVTIFIILGWVVLSAAGYMGKDTVYRSYQQDVKMTPYFVLVLQGVHDGIYPWSGGDALGISEEEDGLIVPEIADIPESESQNPEPESQHPEPETEQELDQGEKEFVPVDESYFDDAVFIGDSRTVGLRDYGGLDRSVFYATVGLNVFDMWKERFCEVNGQKVTLEEALRAGTFQKIYFQIGINEMGRGTIDSFMKAYGEAVQKFHELQPQAVIYVQGIMRVAKEKSDTDPIFNNQGIQQRNERIAQLADNRTVFYIDMNEVVCDASGNLKENLTFDNLHLYGSEYDIWVDFLKTKGVH